MECEHGISDEPCSDCINEYHADQKVITTAIATAISIVNMSDDKHVQTMASHIADSLISLTDMEDL